MKTTLLALALIAAAPAAQAKTWKVPKEVPTIQGAILAAGPGDTIVVSPGRYPGSLDVPAEKAGLTVRGKGRVVIDAGFLPAPGVVALRAPGARLVNLTLVNGWSFGSATSGCGVFVFDSAVGAELERVRVTRCPEAGIRVQARATRLLDCEVFQQERGIRAFADEVTVDRCRTWRTESYGVRIDGDDAVVTRCEIRDVADEGGILVYGQRALAKKNRVDRVNYMGIFFIGSDGRMLKNEVRSAASSGFYVVGQRATFEKNRAFDCDAAGFGFDGDELVVRKNRAERGGIGFSLRCSTSRFEQNLATRCGDGFWIYEGGNELIDNDAVECAGDGFDVQAGDGNVLIGNRALRGHAEGIENNADGTVLRDNLATGNARDIANEGTFAEFVDNVFESGGTSSSWYVDD